MNSNQINDSQTLLLPKLKSEGVDVVAGSVGEWSLQSSKAFQDVASSLEVMTVQRDIKSVSSIPDMWARPLSMEMSLHNDKYPIRSQMIEQWQGMLTAIALAEVRNFKIRAELLEIGKLRDQDAFAKSLFELLPSPAHVLYKREDTDRRLRSYNNPWQDIYVLLWEDKPVGMTTPSTLVCPSEEGVWNGLPWWDGDRLQSPINYLNAEEKTQLYLWLKNLQDVMNEQIVSETKSSINAISSLLENFKNTLNVDPRQQTLHLSSNQQFFDVAINRGVLTALNIPIQVPPQESNVRITLSEGKNQEVILIPDRDNIKTQWVQPEQNIWIYQNINLASLNENNLRGLNVDHLKESEVFLPELYFIVQKNALPGCLLPTGIDSIKYERQDITPILPLNQLLLNCLNPEDLISKVNFELRGSQIRVTLDLQLSGQGGRGKNYRLTKEYTLKKENSFNKVPVLELYPNFKAMGWTEYYLFYYGSGKDGNFQVRLPNAKPENLHEVEDEGRYQITKIDEFPQFIICQKSNVSLGLILIKSPPVVGVNNPNSWKVGIDFGTSFTNVYVSKSNSTDRLKLEPLHLKITASNDEVRERSLLDYFIPEKNMEIPLSSILTTQGARGTDKLIFDGRVYIPEDSVSFRAGSTHIKTGIKWEDKQYARLFLKQFLLQITATAVKNNVKTIQWSISYPSSFSRDETSGYIGEWQRLTKNLQDSTGIIHNCPKNINDTEYRTESLAVAQYFSDKAGLNLTNSVCIDIGGGSSDISIWEDNDLKHQCSVQFAGSRLFSQFIEMNPKFLERFFTEDLSDWLTDKDNPSSSFLSGFAFYAKLDLLMRRESEVWLERKRDEYIKKPEFQGLIQLMALGVAGLYYYVGTILKVLHKEAKYSSQDITPVYLGGNGSRFLRWLADDGHFVNDCPADRLLSRMLSSGSGFKDIQEHTSLSQTAKDEVACGLVLSHLAGATKLKGLDRTTQEFLISGEDCLLNGQVVSCNSRLEYDFETENLEIKVPKLVQLPKFFNDFHKALRDLQIQQHIKPFSGYKISDNLEDNEKLWRDTNKELNALLNKMRGHTSEVRLEPPFILGLKALLRVLSREWANKKWS